MAVNAMSHPTTPLLSRLTNLPTQPFERLDFSDVEFGVWDFNFMCICGYKEQGLINVGVKELNAAGRTTQSSTLKHPNSNMSGHPKLLGEGTCELQVHIG